MPSSGLDSEPSLCVEREWCMSVCGHMCKGVHVSVFYVMVVAAKNVMEQPCVFQHEIWLIHVFLEMVVWFLTCCLLFSDFGSCVPKEGKHSGSAATFVESWRLIDQVSKSWGVCFVTPYCFPWLHEGLIWEHLVFPDPWWFVWSFRINYQCDYVSMLYFTSAELIGD